MPRDKCVRECVCACVCARQVSPTDFGAFDSAFVALFRISAGDAWIESLPQVCVCVCVCVRAHAHACVRACVRARARECARGRACRCA